MKNLQSHLWDSCRYQNFSADARTAQNFKYRFCYDYSFKCDRDNSYKLIVFDC